MDMDISMDIHPKSVDMDMDMDGKFHIHGNPAFSTQKSKNFLGWGLKQPPPQNHSQWRSDPREATQGESQGESPNLLGCLDATTLAPSAHDRPPPSVQLMSGESQARRERGM